MFSAQILKDSLNPCGNRLTTFLLEYPRIIHAELLTHREFSRSSASSRAIRLDRMIEKVENDPFIPEHWGKNQAGMQAYEEVNEFSARIAKTLIKLHIKSTINLAKELGELGLHKQIINRYLEPHQFISVICSTTNLSHFKKLRVDRAAEPHFQKIAKMMCEVYDNSTPEKLNEGEWHLPLIYENDREIPLKDRIKVSAGRCARVSYLTHEGKRDPEKDIELGESLSKNGHFSPLEHQAVALDSPERVGNFTGWKQYRKFFTDEYKEK